MRPAASHGLPRFLGLWPQRNSSSRRAPTGPVGGGREGEGDGQDARGLGSMHWPPQALERLGLVLCILAFSTSSSWQ